MTGMECTRCGWCCDSLPIPLTYSDIMRFIRQGELNILREISYINNYPKRGTGGFYITKTTFNPKQSCPFLDPKKECTIHAIKPKTCKDFPYGLKQHPECALSCELQPNPSRAQEIQAAQYQDFEQAHLNQVQLLKILVIARH